MLMSTKIWLTLWCWCNFVCVCCGTVKYLMPFVELFSWALFAFLQIFVGKIPRDLFEDELVPLFEKAGPIWDLRLMMDPLSGLNRGYAFVTFCTKESAQAAVKLVRLVCGTTKGTDVNSWQVINKRTWAVFWCLTPRLCFDSPQCNNSEIRPGKHIGVCISVANNRLFVGSIPKSKTKEQIVEEFAKVTGEHLWHRWGYPESLSWCYNQCTDIFHSCSGHSCTETKVFMTCGVVHCELNMIICFCFFILVLLWSSSAFFFGLFVSPHRGS